MEVRNAHIVAIRRNGVVEGHQLRVNGGGPGCSKFFGSARYGGADQALRAARRFAKSLALPRTRQRGGSVVGRAPSRSTTGAAGIRFGWSRESVTPILRVIATWTDKRGRMRSTSYSVAANGLEGALDKAIAARTSTGAPMPDRADLLKRLRKERRTGARD